MLWFGQGRVRLGWVGQDWVGSGWLRWGGPIQGKGKEKRDIVPIGPTSRAFSSRAEKAWRTKLICWLCGTYAMPPRMNTLLDPTRSGTLYHGTWFRQYGNSCLRWPAQRRSSHGTLRSCHGTYLILPELGSATKQRMARSTSHIAHRPRPCPDAPASGPGGLTKASSTSTMNSGAAQTLRTRSTPHPP